MLQHLNKEDFMNVKVEFIGAIDSGKYDQISVFEISKNQTIEIFLKSLHFHESHIKFIQVLQNGKRVSQNTVIKDGDKLDLMLMVGGG